MRDINIDKFNEWLDSKGICDFMTVDADEFKYELKSKISHLIESENEEARKQGFYAGCGVGNVEYSKVGHAYNKYVELLNDLKTSGDSDNV